MRFRSGLSQTLLRACASLTVPTTARLALGLTLWCAFASVAQAEAAPSAPLSARGCTGLDHAELERLLALELASLGVDNSRPMQVAIECTADALRLRVSDPGESGHLERVLPSSAVRLPGDERVLALSITQLVLTATQTLPPHTTESPGPSAPPTQHGWLAAGGGARLHEFAEPLPLWQGAALGGYERGRWGLLASLEGAWGTREHALGTVKVMHLSATLGPALRIAAVRRFELWTTARAGVVHVRSRGEPAPGFGAAKVAGVGALAEGGLLPTLRFAPVRFALSGVVGGELGSPAARVEGERSVRTTGLYAAMTLFVALELGRDDQ